MPRLLIVNADDFNLTEGVSRGILEGYRRGILTSTTAMANLPGLESAVAPARDLPGLSVGLHVNLTFGPPVLSPERVRSLVDGTGIFVRDREHVAHAGEPEEIREEVQAQARRFEQAAGMPPSHVDTHYHMHRHPAVFEAVMELAGKLRVPVRALAPEMAEAIRGRGLRCADRLTGDVGAEAYWTVARLHGLIPALPEGVTEICCHPGYWDPALAVSSYGRQREVELQALCDPAVLRAVEESGVRLISYADLGRGMGQRGPDA
jgi:predicted glycoside hydrolase/deacetylase ChbG (UPF0249 family)